MVSQLQPTSLAYVHCTGSEYNIPLCCASLTWPIATTYICAIRTPLGIKYRNTSPSKEKACTRIRNKYKIFPAYGILIIIWDASVSIICQTNSLVYNATECSLLNSYTPLLHQNCLTETMVICTVQSLTFQPFVATLHY